MCVKIQRNITALLMGFFGVHTQTFLYCFGTNPFLFVSVSGIKQISFRIRILAIGCIEIFSYVSDSFWKQI